MIKFKENSDKRLYFIVYPLPRLVGVLALIVVLLPFIYWGLFISPIYSSLECENNTGQVNCLLVERKAIAFKPDKTKIENVRDVDGIIRGLLNNKQIVIKANPEQSSFRLIGYQKKYYYPSTANTLINMNFKSGFTLFEQRTQIVDFIQGKTNLDNIKVELKLSLITLIFTLFPNFLFISILLNSPFKNTYNLDRENKTVTISAKRIILDDITKIYSLNEIEQVRFDRDDSEKIAVGTIVLQFAPDLDYPVAEFADLEYGTEVFEIIRKFIDKSR